MLTEHPFHHTPSTVSGGCRPGSRNTGSLPGVTCYTVSQRGLGSFQLCQRRL